MMMMMMTTAAASTTATMMMTQMVYFVGACFASVSLSRQSLVILFLLAFRDSKLSMNYLTAFA